MQITSANPKINALIELTRVRKFAGTLVLFWPYAWSLTMHANSLSPQRYIELVIYGLIGASLLHSAGCIWNDILDREIDRKVERTKKRPLADRRITVSGAMIFLTIHLVLLLALVWRATAVVWRCSLVAIFILPGVYPLMKRITYWPQAWLGLAMNAGVPVAALIALDAITPSTVALAAAAWSWTVYYDTVYACQDKRDDARAGVKSTALLFNRQTRLILNVFGLLFVTLLIISGFYADSTSTYYIISIGGGGTFLFKELYQTNLDDPKSCWKTFERNAFYLGGIIWAGTLSQMAARYVL